MKENKLPGIMNDGMVWYESSAVGRLAASPISNFHHCRVRFNHEACAIHKRLVSS